MKVLVAIALIFNVYASAEMNDIFKSKYEEIANPKDCPEICGNGNIIQTGASTFKTMTKTMLKAYVIPTFPPFDKCTVYGVPNFDVTDYKCKTDGNLFDNWYHATWHNMTVKCTVSLEKNPAKVAAALNKKVEPVAPCGTTIPVVDTNTYDDINCAAGSDEGVSKVKMIAYLGRVDTTPTMRGDRTLQSVYPLHLAIDVTSPAKAFTFYEVPAGFEKSVECLTSNQKAVQRRLLTGYCDTMYQCSSGKDQTIRMVQDLAYQVLSCINLPTS